MNSFLKQKIKRLIFMGCIFCFFAIIGVGVGISSITMQSKLEETLSAQLNNPKTSPLTKLLLSLSENSQKTYLVMGIIFAIMGGFCFAAAKTLKRQNG